LAVDRRWRRILGRVLTVLFIAAAFFFLGLTIAGNLEELRAFPWTVRPLMLGVSLLALVGAFLWGIFVWQVILRHFGAAADYGPLARIWFVSNLGKYIPGKVWQLVGVAQMGTASGLSPVLSVTSLLLQMIFAVVGGFTVIALFLPGDTPYGGPWLGVLRWTLLPAALILVHPRVLATAMGIVRRVTRQELAPWQGSWFDGLMLLLLSVVSWVVYGAAFHLFLAAFVPVRIELFGPLVAMNALAFLVGYAVFITPAGLGAKEGALAALLALYFPVPVAASMALVARLWTVAGEVVPALILLPVRTPPCDNGAEEP
jgi:glycosyltransferase 2 family protein